MPEYRVTWVIDLDADNPVEAVKLARKMQLLPDTTATIFEVEDTTTGETQEIDLYDLG